MNAKPIVAGTDGSEESLLAVEWAAREALLRGTSLRIVSATSLLPRMAGQRDRAQLETVTDLLRADRDRALAAAAARVAAMAPGLPVGIRPLEEAPATAVTGSGSGAAMLVLGSRGAGAFTAMVLGSVSRYAASHASCPVVVVRDQAGTMHRQLGVGVADPEGRDGTFAFAFEEASLRQAGLIVLHAWQTPQTEISRAGQAFTPPGPHITEVQAARALAALLDGWRAKYPDVPVTQEIVHGHPARALAGLCAGTDLVVIGRQARHPSLQGPGTVRHAMLNHAHGPVAVVAS